MYSIIALVSLCAVSTTSQYSGYPVKIPQQQYYPANYPAQQRQYYPANYPAQQRQYYPTNYPVQVQQQQYYPVQPQRVDGSSLYGYQIPSYLIGRTDQPVGTLIPPYTSIVKALDEASNEVKEHILLPVKPLPRSTLRNDIVIGGKLSKLPPLFQYVTILTTINDLIDGLIKTNKGAYDTIYETTVTNVIIKILSDPISATNSVKDRLDETNGQIALIRDFIRKKQQTDCKDPISHECDTIIDKAVQQSTNPLLKHEANLLTALDSATKLFNTQYASEFDRVADSLGGVAYVVNDYGRYRLKPLVLAGYEAMKISQNVPSAVGKRRTPYPLLLNSQTPDITLAPFLANKQSPDITLVPSRGNEHTPDITLLPFLGNKQTSHITLTP